MTTPTSQSLQPLPSSIDVGLDGSQLAEMLHCPGCSQVPEPPIQLCVEGHSVCQKCVLRLKTCPLCNKEFSSARNLLAEKLVQCLSMKCSYAKDGCDRVLSKSEWESHGIECPFRQVVCDLMQKKTCFNVKMNYKKYFSHLKNVHSIEGVEATIINVTQFVTSEQSSLSTDIPRGMWPAQYLQACNEIFLTGTGLLGGKMFWWLSLIGTDSIAAKYIAKVSLTIKSKLYEQSWTGPVHSFRVPPEEILAKGLCLLATTETLKPFLYTKDQPATTTSDDSQTNVGWNLTYSVMKIEKWIKSAQPSKPNPPASSNCTASSTCSGSQKKKSPVTHLSVNIKKGKSTNDLNVLAGLSLQ